MIVKFVCFFIHPSCGQFGYIICHLKMLSFLGIYFIFVFLVPIIKMSCVSIFDIFLFLYRIQTNDKIYREVKMSKEKETDAATVLSQMSQLVGMPFDLSTSLSSTEHDSILDADTIGATCTLQPSSLGIYIYSPCSSS